MVNRPDLRAQKLLRKDARRSPVRFGGVPALRSFYRVQRRPQGHRSWHPDANHGPARSFSSYRLAQTENCEVRPWIASLSSCFELSCLRHHSARAGAIERGQLPKVAHAGRCIPARHRPPNLLAVAFGEHTLSEVAEF